MAFLSAFLTFGGCSRVPSGLSFLGRPNGFDPSFRILGFLITPLVASPKLGDVTDGEIVLFGRGGDAAEAIVFFLGGSLFCCCFLYFRFFVAFSPSAITASTSESSSADSRALNSRGPQLT